MRERAALDLMARLITTTNGWDDASVEQWTRLLAELTDYAAAGTATDQLINTWTHGNRPPWGKFRELYDANIAVPPAIARFVDPRAVSFEQHLANLQERKERGDKDATDELANWQQSIGISSVWIGFLRSLPT